MLDQQDSIPSKLQLETGQHMKPICLFLIVECIMLTLDPVEDAMANLEYLRLGRC